MKDIARRGFLKIATLGAASLPQIGAKVGGASWGAIGGYGGAVGAASSEPAWMRSTLSKMAWKALQKNVNDLERQFDERASYRVAGLDADLYQRKSGSHPWRVKLQMKRDREYRKELEAKRMKLWPDED